MCYRAHCSRTTLCASVRTSFLSAVCRIEPSILKAVLPSKHRKVKVTRRVSKVLYPDCLEPKI